MNLSKIANKDPYRTSLRCSPKDKKIDLYYVHILLDELMHER